MNEIDLKSMNQFDFKSWYVLLAIFIAHIYRHYSVLEEIPKTYKLLEDALEDLSNDKGIEKRCKQVKSALLSLDAIILHLLAVLVLITIVLLVFNIPQNALDPEEFGPLAYPFNPGEKFVYLLVAFLFLLSYVTKAIVPSFNAITLLLRVQKANKRTNA